MPVRVDGWKMHIGVKTNGIWWDPKFEKAHFRLCISWMETCRFPPEATKKQLLQRGEVP